MEKRIPKKATILLDVYSNELQMWLEKNDSQKTKEIHQKATQIIKNNPGILNSKLALIHYCGGRLLMEQKDWEAANRSLYEAYHFWEESGDPLRIPCLRLILIANMLMGSKINPFDSPNTKNLRQHSEIKTIADLLDAFHGRKLSDFERIFQESGASLTGDRFMNVFLPDLWREMRTKVLLHAIKPYTRLHIPFLAKVLHVSDAEVESLLVSLILDSKVLGRIDQVNQLLVLSVTSSQMKYRAINKWSSQLSSIHSSIVNRLN